MATQTSRMMVAMLTKPPAAKIMKTLIFFLKDMFSANINTIGKAMIIVSETTLIVVSVRKISSCARHFPCVTSIPCQNVLIGWQMFIFAIVAAIVYAINIVLNTYIEITQFRYGAKNRASMKRIDSLTASTVGPYITIWA
jgi:hypothetical protein